MVPLAAAADEAPSVTVENGNLIFVLNSSKSVLIEQGTNTLDLLTVIASMQASLSDAHATIAALNQTCADLQQELGATRATLNASISAVAQDVSQLANATDLQLNQKADADEVSLALASAVDSMRDYANEVGTATAQAAAEARQILVNTTAFAAYRSEIADLVATLVTKAALADNLDDILEEMALLLDHELTYVYGNMSLLNGTISSATFNANADSILNCFSQGLVFDADLNRCVPTFVHGGCSASGPVIAHLAASTCTNRSFDGTCLVTCAENYSPERSATYVCNEFAEWVPVSGDALVCADSDECAAGAPCPDMATCVNLEGSYECRCPSGNFTIDPNADSCYGLFVRFLDRPERMLFDFESNCEKLEQDVPTVIPTDAVAVLASLSMYNSLGNDHCVYSLGRDNDVPCSNYDNDVYNANTYLNDILQTQNGDNGGAQGDGMAVGTTIIPLAGRTIKGGVSGLTRGVNSLTVYIYGYLTGAGESTLLSVNQVHNLRQTSNRGFSKYDLKPSHIPATGVAGVLTASSMFVSNRDDHFNMAFGRDTSNMPNNWDNAPYTSALQYWGDAVTTNEGDSSVASAHYGWSTFLMTGSLGDGTIKVDAGMGANSDNPTVYLTLQVFGYIPSAPFTNIIYLPTSAARTMKFAPTARTVTTGISPPAGSGVPTNAKALITTIYTHEHTSSSDHVVHTFGRDATHTASIIRNGIHDSNVYFNDVQISHDGGTAGSRWYYGHWHGTQIIPLKDDGTFDAVFCDSESTPGTAHYITIAVIGYVAA
ncbi:uncharacterized protein MONBRDRAFT_34480 [Monosiga brevicollis MX1]|uniref:EGF-like domain-containing protein n=1 Tax=Monosiga brevicollis TaxID=81824 RepID=A9VC07_MONBE|nr:uncharacterized protein MONBRDRAFT_34480 [Monosiga brevicollis MX1]EDQ84942.1 predicted protein [Monosiga brevicollis MX1]|eukprot:XP_001750283.1 hypothetical protein [Monosiga brevicollis MX1]